MVKSENCIITSKQITRNGGTVICS